MKMSARHMMKWLVCVVAAVLLSGCPFSGELLVQPGSVSLSINQSTAQISVINAGSGTLSWTARAGQPWLLLRLGEEGSAEAQISGKTVKTDIITLFLDASRLPGTDERLRGTVFITSGGGDEEISVTFEPDRQPRLTIQPVTLHFKSSETKKTIDLTNEGAATLLWQSRVASASPWLSVTPSSGETTAGSAQVLSIAVDRAMLTPAAEPYQGELVFESNGGRQSLAVTVDVGAFSLSPLELDFGLIAAPKTLLASLRTQSPEAVVLTSEIEYGSGNAWLSVTPAALQASRTKPLDLSITANPAGLAPGNYSAVLKLSHVPTGQQEQISLKMEVGKAADFLIDPDEINFGDLNGTATATLTLTNAGDAPFTYQVQKQSPAPWLTISPESAAITNTGTVTLVADTTRQPAGSAQVTLEFKAGAVLKLVRVSVNRTPDPKKDKLEVEPRDLNFGSRENKKDINLWNEGPGAINWSIDTSDFPAWLSISSTGGSLSGAFTETVSFAINRELAPAGEENFSHTVKVQSSLPDAEPVEVTVRAQARRFPQISLTGEGVDVTNIPFIMMDINENSAQFSVENLGNAALTWNVADDHLPDWISSITPLQGDLAPGKMQKVTVTTDRTGLDNRGGTYRLPIRSNDTEAPTSFLDVHVRVPYSIVIGVQPPKLNFGRSQSTLTFQVANLGDAGVPLDYIVTSSQPGWLFAEPARGRSMGTAGAVKDWQFVSVAIDRSSITGTGAAATLLITADNVPPNASPVVPVEVTVQLDLAELSIESASPQFRPPSLIRASVLLRDIRQRTFPMFKDDLLDSRTLYRLATPRVDILENSLPVDLAETNVFVKKDESLSFAMLILLDFSGSMAQAARALVDDGQLQPAPGEDPLTALYREAVGGILDEVPPHYRVGLAVFNERNPWWGGAMRILTGAPAGYDSKASGASFTSNQDILRYRLNTLQVVDNGATPLYTAIAEGALALFRLGGNMPDFDNLGQCILLPITDGKRTTPPGEITALTEILRATRTRTFTIGWGSEVYANSLIQIADESGGHYYATSTKRIPGTVGADGNPLTLPVKAELMKWCKKDPDDENAPTIVSDLKSHIVLSYVTLNEESSMDIQARFELDVATPPLKESLYVSQIPSIEFANDVRLGQIGTHTDGIRSDGSASVRFYADYIPRNITRLVFELNASDGSPWSASLLPAEQGGLVAHWSMSRNGNMLILETPSAGRALDYGDYGNLFQLDFTGLSAPVYLSVNMLEPVIGGGADGKYFTIPRGIDIGYEEMKAVSFPNPAFAFLPPLLSPESSIIDLGNLKDLPEDERQGLVQVRNIGGEHMPTFAGLHWSVREGTEWLPGTFPGKLSFVYDTTLPPVYSSFYSIYETAEAAVVPIGHYDTGGVLISDPGPYSRAFYIDVTYGSLFYQFSYGPYYLSYEVE